MCIILFLHLFIYLFIYSLVTYDTLGKFKSLYARETKYVNE